MTRGKKRKAAVRETQRATGLRYTKAARVTAGPTGGRIGQSFTLQELLGECASLPPATVDWGWGPEYEDIQGPDVFQSRLLGAAIPFGTVLALAGELAREGRDTSLQIELLSPLEAAVVSSNPRRFQLLISQDGVSELCRKPSCGRSPEDSLILWCADHLAECAPDTLTETAREWGYAQCELAGSDPAGREGTKEAAVLIRAAVAQGAYKKVVSVLLDACFEPDDMIDEMFWDPMDAMAMRQAIDREQLRLERIAEVEYRRIQEAAKVCMACGKAFRYGVDLDVPARYCTSGCVPLPPAKSNPEPEPGPWSVADPTDEQLG
ncbi:hypothetical protein [Streptomyces sp. NBC_00057]|uniref:hypothetical protein n=1 Tax=Streptomyces sp. NBC_00057 TaxID=2975634 RepID=UPI0032546922